MKTEPIKDKALIKDVANYLNNRNERDYIMFILGIHTGLRISDILNLKVSDVKGKYYIYIKEKKTNKQKRIPVQPKIKKILDKYTLTKGNSEPLIKSRKGLYKPITRQRAYTILSEVGEIYGIEHIGTHTLRKTFGYHHYNKHKNVAYLQKIFNHGTQYETLKYIGMLQQEVDESILEMDLL